MKISFGRNGTLLGDYDEEAVPGLLESKKILLTDIYWHEGMAQWAPVSERWKEVPDEPIWPALRIGLLMLGCGAALSWFFIIEPIRDAQNQADSVSTSMKGTLAIPFCAFFGFFYSFMPRFARRVFGLPEDRKASTGGISVLLLIAGGALYWLIEKKLADYGYTR